jgi:hypothetical protein
MSIKKTSRRIAVFCLVIGAALAAFAQEPQPEPRKFLPPQARMAAAKTVYLRNAGGSDIPFNIIQAGIESWPRYTIVDSPEKADLIVEVLSPEESQSTSGSKTKVGADAGGRSADDTDSHISPGIQIIKLTVSDAKTGATLFSATERPKDAWKDKTRTESQIECTQKLFALFHNRVEPPQSAPPAPSSK